MGTLHQILPVWALTINGEFTVDGTGGLAVYPSEAAVLRLPLAQTKGAKATKLRIVIDKVKKPQTTNNP